MGKVDLGTTKYVIHARIETNGVVEKPDVVGAIFGQTEGLLGSDLDLRELQKTGRIGRIEVDIESKGGKSRGKIDVPSSLDKVETAILAAALETIDRVGPCEAHMILDGIEDVRVSKRKKVIDRAKNILSTMIEEITPDSQEITDEVKEAFRLKEIQEYGKEKLPAGPNIDDSDAIITVEGRADVLLLLKHGIKNTIAVEGTNIPNTVVELAKRKTTTVFVDDDRGGELILRELLQLTDIDFVARAPDGKEVEDLTKKEIFKALRNKIPAEQVMDLLSIKVNKEDMRTKFGFKGKKDVVEKPRPPPPPQPKKFKKPAPVAAPAEVAPPKINGKVVKFKKLFTDLSGTLKAYLLDQDANIIKEVAVRDLAVALKNAKDKVSVVIFDGVITQRLVEIAKEKEVEFLLGAKIGNINKKPAEVRLLTASDLGLT